MHNFPALSRCYVPPIASTGKKQSLPSQQGNESPQESHQEEEEEEEASTLRQVRLQTNLLSNGHILGSSLVEWGHTKVLASVQGPHLFAEGGGGLLTCQVRYAPMALPSWLVPQEAIALGITNETTPAGNTISSSSSQSARWATVRPEEVELSHAVRNAILPSILPPTTAMTWNVSLEIIQMDGGILAACILATSLALANAGVELYDLVTACTVATLPKDEVVVVDPTGEQTRRATRLLTVALVPTWRRVCAWEYQTFLSSGASPSLQLMELAKNACLTLYPLAQACLRGDN